MYTNSYEQFLIMEATIESNKQQSDEKMKNLTEDLKSMTTSTIKSTMGHMNINKFSPGQNNHQILRTLPLWSQLTGELHHWTVDIIRKLVACGISNMRSDHQNSMKSSSRQN